MGRRVPGAGVVNDGVARRFPPGVADVECDVTGKGESDDAEAAGTEAAGDGVCADSSEADGAAGADVATGSGTASNEEEFFAGGVYAGTDTGVARRGVGGA